MHNTRQYFFHYIHLLYWLEVYNYLKVRRSELSFATVANALISQNLKCSTCCRSVLDFHSNVINNHYQVAFFSTKDLLCVLFSECSFNIINHLFYFQSVVCYKCVHVMFGFSISRSHNSFGSLDQKSWYFIYKVKGLSSFCFSWLLRAKLGKKILCLRLREPFFILIYMHHWSNSV